MGGDGPKVRDCAAADLAAVARIYGHHVMHGLASFEETPPDPAEMGRRLAATRDRGLPYLVGTLDGAVMGFAYVTPFRGRPGYRYSLEDSVYVAPEASRRGLGAALLAALIERCTALGYRQMVAVIGDTANAASIELHRRLGFRDAGVLRDIGFKHGRWVDSVYMQLSLGAGGDTVPPDADSVDAAEAKKGAAPEAQPE